jgi:hypothetical protein
MTSLVRRTLVIAGAAVLISLAAIGTLRATSLPGSAPALRRAPLGPLRKLPAPDSTVVDDRLGADLDAILAADQATAAPPRAAIRGDLRRLAAWRRLVHATVVVDLKQGGLTTIQLDHGTISAVGASSVTIAETGGGSVTVSLGAETRVRRNAAKAAIADLKTADEVFVISKVEAGGTTAYLVVMPPR